MIQQSPSGQNLGRYISMSKSDLSKVKVLKKCWKLEVENILYKIIKLYNYYTIICQDVEKVLKIRGGSGLFFAGSGQAGLYSLGTGFW
jgi:hypothetical protein